MTRTWLITGGASGLGREIARAALSAGDTAILADRDPAGAEEVVTAYPDQAEAVQLDVTDMARIADVVGDVTSRHGGIDVLVNTAGRGHVGAVEDTPMHRLGRPEDMAGVAIYLASEAGSYVTAAQIAVDGGMLTVG